MHDMVVVEFGTNLLLVDSLPWKNIKDGENKYNRTLKRFHAQENSKCNHSRKHNCDELSNDVIRSVLLLHIAANLGMMLARDYSSCHATRNTLVMLVANNMQKLRWPAKTLTLNPLDHLLDQLKRKVRAQPLQLNLRELMRVIHQMFTAIPQHIFIDTLTYQRAYGTFL